MTGCLLRCFIGSIDCYRCIWPKRAHVLAPSTNTAGKYGNKKQKFEWTSKMNRTFKETKLLLASDEVTHYPDYNIPFHIYVDTSDYQLCRNMHCSAT